MKDSEIDEALEIIAAIEDDYDKVVTLSTILSMINDPNNPSYSKILFKALEIIENITNKYNKVSAILTLAKAVKSADSKLYKNLIEMSQLEARDIMNKKARARAFIEIALETAFDDIFLTTYEKAIDAIAEISILEDREETLLFFIEGLTERGKKKEAVVLLDGFVDPYYHVLALSSIMGTLAKENDPAYIDFMKKALMNIANIKSEYMRDWALSDICSNLAEAGKINEALAISKNIKSENAKISAMVKIILELVEMGEIKKANRMAALISNDVYKSKIKAKMAIKLVRLDKFDEAIDLALSIKKPEYRDLVFRDIASELAQNRHFEKALEVIDNINDLYQKVMALIKIAMEFLEIGDSRYYKVLDKAVEIANEIENPQKKSSALSIISTLMASVSLRNNIRNIITMKIRDAEVYINKRQYDKALREYIEAKELAKNANMRIFELELEKRIEALKKQLSQSTSESD